MLLVFLFSPFFAKNLYYGQKQIFLVKLESFNEMLLLLFPDLNFDDDSTDIATLLCHVQIFLFLFSKTYVKTKINFEFWKKSFFGYQKMMDTPTRKHIYLNNKTIYSNCRCPNFNSCNSNSNCLCFSSRLRLSVTRRSLSTLNSISRLLCWKKKCVWVCGGGDFALCIIWSH